MTFLKFFVLALSTLLVACDSGDSSSDAGEDAGDDANAECSDADTFDTSQCPDTYPDLECVVYVDGDAASSGDGWSWSNAVKTVQEGIDLAHCGAEIHGVCEQWQVWVKKGTYFIHQGCREHTVRLRQGVMLLGGFAGNETSDFERDWETNVTILDGRDGGGTNHVYHVVTGADSATLDGFTVTGGNADHEDQNSVHAMGGGMLNDYTSPLIANCIFKENTARFEGGGMCSRNGSPNVSDCVFTDNSAQYGGGMYGTSSSTVVSACTFIGNSAEQGGGMAESSPTEAKVMDSLFKENSASIFGAGLAIGNGDITVENTMFESNTADGPESGLPAGGGFGCASNSVCTVTNCTFTSNTAPYGGAGIYSDLSAIRITGSSFSDNETKKSPAELGWSSGAGFGCFGYSECKVTDCTFTSNTARIGGGMSCENSTTTITGSSFSGNEAGYCGGGVHVEGSIATVEGSTFEENSGAQFGGGINCIEYYGSQSDCDVSDSTFTSNTSYSGGGMYIQSSTAAITEADFYQNEANKGGGVMVNNSSTATITRAVFVENEAISGGALWAKVSTLNLGESLFSNNSADTGGGALLSQNDSVEITNCAFLHNTSNNVGGGLSTGENLLLSVHHCTFADNFATNGGGTIDIVNEPLEITNSILWNESSPEILVPEGADMPVVTFSDVRGGWEGAGNIDADPLFVDSENGDLHLQAGSPCIGAASPDAGVEMDIEGNPRDDEPDMGAYEYVE